MGPAEIGVHVLEVVPHHEGESSLGELLPSDEPGPADEVSVSLRRQTLERALDRLSEREREGVALRFGLTGEDPAPLRETGRRLGLSPERVRQIEARALEHLARTRELEGMGAAA